MIGLIVIIIAVSVVFITGKLPSSISVLLRQ
jgi:hypothetical protein